MTKGMLKRRWVSSALLMLGFVVLSFSGQHEVLAVEVTTVPMMLVAQAESNDPAGVVQPSNAANLSEESAGGVEVVADVPIVGKKEEAPLLENFQFSLPSVQLGGDISGGISRQSYTPGRKFSRDFSAVNLRAATYIWQPWFAQLKGGVGVISGKNYTGFQQVDDTSVVGNGTLSMFSQSRFPLSVSHVVSDSRTSVGALTPNINFTSKSTDVRQTYRPLSGLSDTNAYYNRSNSTILPINSQVGRESIGKRYNLQHEQRLPDSSTRFGLAYDYNNLNIAESGDNLVIAKTANASTQFVNQTLSAEVRRNESKFDVNSTDLQSQGSNVNHIYRPSSLFSLVTQGMYDKTHSSAPINVIDNHFLQATTTAAWQPDADLPLFISAGGNFSENKTESVNPAIATPLVENISKNRSGNLSASYNASPNVNYSLAGIYASTRSNVIDNQSWSGSGGANYLSNTQQFGIASYNWNANAAAVAASHTTQRSSRSLSGGLGHALNAPKTLQDGSSLDINAGQSLLVRDSLLNGLSTSLTNTAGALWRPLAGETTSGSVSLAVADIRIMGGDNRNQYQTLTLGVNGLNQSSVNSRATGAATLQWSNNGRGQVTKTANASLGYQHDRPFDVQGLRYNLSLSVLYMNFENTVTEINQLNRRSGSILDQSLNYNIGRTFVRLNGIISRFTNFNSDSIFVLIGRNFGSI
jgi:hypothetical protein